MVNTIKAEFRIRLQNNKWMDVFTKRAAIRKLDEMNYKIGAPTEWPAYPFTTGGNYMQNKMALNKHKAAGSIAQYGEGVDNTQWGMSPSEINAYYAMQKNEMVFPAGILQPPFFDTSQPMVVNYAAIGSVMGHELTHGFDNTGAKFDKFGRYKKWWSGSTYKTYTRKASCFPTQYSGIKIKNLDQFNLKVNGNKTLGENIADNGGVRVSLNAYGRFASQYGAPTVFKTGGNQFTADQLFWISWGQAWCKAQHPALLARQVLMDVHAPSQARTNGVAMNSVMFAQAFGCKTGTDMNPAKKCKLW